jgi:anti-sigma B factor antagonist
MDLRVSNEQGYVLAEVSGRIDDSAGELFRNQLHDALGGGGTRLILDLSGSPYVNSMGLSHLVTLVAYANSKSSRVIICGATTHVAGVLAVTKLDRFFDIAPTRTEAIERKSS